MSEKTKNKYNLTDQDRLIDIAGNAAAALLLIGCFLKIMFLTSGKFTNANVIPNEALPFFTWNPMFHLIDQMRGAAFVNYTPHNTNLVYPIIVMFFLVVAGHILHDYMLRHRNVMG